MQILSSVLVERSLDLLIAASMFLVTFPLISQLEAMRPIAITLLLFFIGLLVFFFIVSTYSETVKKKLRKFGKRNSFYMRKILPMVEMLIDGFKVLTNWKQFTMVLFWIAVSWALWTFIIFYGINIINNGAHFWWAIFTFRDGLRFTKA